MIGWRPSRFIYTCMPRNQWVHACLARGAPNCGVGHGELSDGDRWHCAVLRQVPPWWPNINISFLRVGTRLDQLTARPTRTAARTHEPAPLVFRNVCSYRSQHARPDSPRVRPASVARHVRGAWCSSPCLRRGARSACAMATGRIVHGQQLLLQPAISS